ncbi:hypothetical protein [Brazilian marseillevirus]|uniref:hypothetical protein n=1 Tax=Brazilian marseillevirus TaxID=1813599 RepID=UPI000785B5C1|nr:hypothetical protein A3303_gp009 [Brazilian marseillevirus]AMQ10517.1 hypothetical protein [Brazilian marseillevirus]
MFSSVAAKGKDKFHSCVQPNKMSEISIRSKLLKVKYDGKWCIFRCYDLDKEEEFRESGKLWYLGDALRASGIDASKWDEYGFGDVVDLMIELQTEIIWEVPDGWNLFPVRIGKGKRRLRKKLLKL